LNIRTLSYFKFLRHAELVSASLFTVNLHHKHETLKQVQGDVLNYDSLQTFNKFFTKQLVTLHVAPYIFCLYE